MARAPHLATSTYPAAAVHRDLARRWRELPWVPWSPPARRTVVLVAHPDDEVLGCGGLILAQLARRLPVWLITASDGEAAPSSLGRDELRRARRLEQAVAVERLGLDRAHQVHCSLPDGGIADHQRQLTDCLLACLQPGDLLVAPWWGDHHHDHEACGRAAAAAAAAVEVAVAWSLVWGPLRSEPPGPAELPLGRLRLGVGDHHRRRWALAAHRSQLTNDLGPAVVEPALQARLEDPTEWYVTDRR